MFSCLTFLYHLGRLVVLYDGASHLSIGFFNFFEIRICLKSLSGNFGVFAAVSVPESLERTTNSLEMARFPYGNIR